MMTLEQQSYLLLSNMGVFNQKANLVEQMIPHLEASRLFLHAGYYRTCLEFFKVHHQFPDAAYLENQFPDKFERSSAKISGGIVREFIREIQFDSVVFRADKALKDRNLDDVKAILSGFGKFTTIRPSTSPKDLIERYNVLYTRPAGINLHIENIDNVLRGICYGMTGVIAARPSRGKSMTLKSSMYQVAQGEYNIAILSLEDDPERIWYDLAVRYAFEHGETFDCQDVKKGKLTKEQKVRFDSWLEKMQDEAWCRRIKIYYPADLPNLSFESIIDMIETADSEFFEENGKGLDIFALDYIQEMAGLIPGVMDMKAYLNQFLVAIARYTKDFKPKHLVHEDKARGLISIILSQLNRDGELIMNKNEAADFRCLAELNQLERSADWIVVQHATDEEMVAGILKGQVLKNRFGEKMDRLEPIGFQPAQVIIGGGASSVYNAESLPSVGDFDGGSDGWM